MESRSVNVVIAIATVLAVLLSVIALVGKDMVKAQLVGGGPNVFHMGLWQSCASGANGSEICQKIDTKTKNAELLKVARPFAGVSLLLVAVGMIVALLGAQSSKKGMYVLLLVLLVLGALGSWVTVILVAIFKGKNVNSNLGASWIVYIVAAGLATLGAVFSGIGVKGANDGMVPDSYEA